MLKRIISILLVAVMLLSSILAISISVDAAETASFVPTFNTSRDKPVSKEFYRTGTASGKNVAVYGDNVVDTPEERIALMDLRLEKGNIQLYIDAFSGEVAIKNKATGEMLFTNPYDATTKKNNDALLSQIEISYTSLKTSGTAKGTYNSFKDAALASQFASATDIAKADAGAVPSQIIVKYIPDGLRVEYSIGRLDSRLLLPVVMTPEFIEENIFKAAEENGCKKADLDQLKAYFSETKLHVAAEGEELLEAEKTANKANLEKWPMLQKTLEDGTIEYVTLYTLDSDTGTTEKKKLENRIKTYCPDLTYEMIDAHYRELGYVPKEEPSPLFKVALEYTLEENGVSVRLPANGLRFDETAFRLEDISILPYMGACSINNDGYIFYPDGSGALISFELLRNNQQGGPRAADIYDEDYGKSQLSSGHRHYEKARYPVFGMVETTKNAVTGKESTHGFVAIVESGEAMSSITALSKKINSHNYAITHIKTNPRPYDEIKLSGSAAWQVVSERKYAGDYQIRYIMLSGDDASYVGMAKEYREYLEDKGVLTKLTEKDVEKDVPLYIESFGAIETTKRFLSIPYSTNVALTSFENITTMYDQLSERGISNVDFILTGFSEGGLTNSTVPYDIDWDSSVEEEMDFEELLADARKNGYGVYPDFDFSFSGNDEWFDGFSLDDHAVKTIDGRYASKREYSATRQTQINYYEMAISPSVFSHFYESFTEEYSELNPQGLSVSALGTYLYSDFDEDEPYNREDSKQFTVEAFKYFKETKKYSKVLTSAGNAYSWQYVDVITDVSTISSSYKYASATVPFIGIVLHGYIEIATTPINLEGDVDYALLRAIENGAALKFILSYDNTELLKDNYATSVHYSVRYDTWLPTLVSYYEKINEVLGGDAQTSTIEDHKFIKTATRVPDIDELHFDADALINALIAQEKAAFENENETARTTIQNIRTKLLRYKEILDGEWNDTYSTALVAFEEVMIALNAARTKMIEADAALAKATEEFDDMKEKVLASSKPDYTGEQKYTSDDLKPYTEAKDTATKNATAATNEYNSAYDAFNSARVAFLEVLNARKTELLNVEADKEFFAENFDLIAQTNAFNETFVASLQALLDEFNAKKNVFDDKLAIIETEIAICKLINYKDIMDGNWDDSYEDVKKTLDEKLTALTTASANKAEAEAALKAATDALNRAKKGDDVSALETAKADAEKALETATKAYDTATKALNTAYEAYYKVADARRVALETVEADAALFAANLARLGEAAGVSEAFIADIQVIIDEFNSKKTELAATFAAIDAEIKSYDENILAVYPEFEGAPKNEEADENEGATEDAISYNKYDVADNTVVYEKFSNGRELVLNFNNFDIKVTVNNKSYFVAAYDYIILN